MNDAPTPTALGRILALGLYVLGGELRWAVKKGIARLFCRNGDDALNAWRKTQIDKRKQRFSLA